MEKSWEGTTRLGQIQIGLAIGRGRIEPRWIELGWIALGRIALDQVGCSELRDGNESACLRRWAVQGLRVGQGFGERERVQR